MMKKLFTLFIAITLFTSAKAQWVTIPDANFVTWLNNNGYSSAMSGNQLNTSSTIVTSANSMACWGSNIFDLTGIQYFTALTNLDCYGNQLTSLPVLPSSLINLNCSNNQLTSLSSLPPSLQNLDCYSNQLSSLPILSLTLINLDCSNNQLTSSPSLPSALIQVDFSNNQLTSLPALPSSLTKLYCSINQLTSLVSLPSTLTDLGCSSNQLTNLPPLSAFLIGLECANNQLTNLPYLPTTLTGLNCSNNQLTNLPALPSSLINLYCSNNQLTNLPTIPSTLTDLYCAYNQLVNLPALSSSLINLYCSNNQLTNLPTIPSTLTDLYCNDNQLIILPFLTSALKYLDCSNNQLRSLPTFPTTLKYLYCNNNQLHCLPDLKKIGTLYCNSNLIACFPNYGWNNQLYNQFHSQYPICGLFNSTSCEMYWNISGTIYVDKNSSCTYDAADTVLKNIKVELWRKSNLEQQTFSRPDGSYTFDVNVYDTFQIKIDTTNIPFYLSCPSQSSYTSIISATDSIDANLNFGMQCKTILDDIVAQNIITTRHRPGRTVTINLQAGLKRIYGFECSNANSSGKIKLLKSGSIEFLNNNSYSISPTIISTDSLIWNVVDFNSFMNNISFKAQVDTQAQIGQSVCYQLIVEHNFVDVNHNNDTLNLCFPILNGYDPNEKSGRLNVVDSIITYTVQFQNTGNDTAQHIIVKDTLSNDLDITTLEVLNYSFQPFTQTFGNVAVFNFPNINLVDSATNELGSHGFVTFKIKVKPNALSSIQNQAAIYFDFNPPIYTNTTTTGLCYQPTFSKINQYSCPSLSFVFNNHVINKSGVYLDTLQNQFGCDSIIAFNLVHPHNYEIHEICNGSSYFFGGKNYSISGAYDDTLQSYLGCDSIRTMLLNVKPISNYYFNQTICSNQFYSFNNHQLNSTGTYYDTLQNYLGCDSIITLNMNVKPISSYSYTQSICSNQFYSFNNQNLNQTGIYFDTLQNYIGCDSIVTLHLNVKPISNYSFTQNICIGSSYYFNGNNLTATGIYYDTLQNYLGCDSFITLHLNVNQPSSKTIYQTICSNKTYNLNGTILYQSGIYYNTIQNHFGCDSFITLNLFVNPVSSYSYNQTICSNQSYLFNNHNLNQTGIYYDTLQNYLGCDSFITLNLNVKPVSNYPYTQTICSNQYYSFNNHQLNLTGIYYDTLQNYVGCDSFITLNLIVNPISNYSYTQNICIGSSYAFNGNNLTTAGIYFDTLQNYLGCDSFITLHLNVNQPSSNNFTKTICSNSFYNLNGTILNQNGIYYDTIQNHSGCDSFITLHLVVKPISSYSFNKTICSNDFYSFNHLLLNSTGSYFDTLINHNGCDSFITLHLTVLPTSASSFTKTICSNNPFLFNGHLLSQSGNYKDTLMNYVGCDSIITLHLIAKPSYLYNSTTLTVCEGSAYFYNGHVYTTNTQLYDTFISQLGCDSIVGIKIIAIPAPDTSVVQSGNTLIAQAQHSSFYWYDCTQHQLIQNANDDTFMVHHSGSYAVLVKDSLTLCSDTSNCRTIVVSGVEEVENSKLSIYPNPCGEKLLVTGYQLLVNTIEITDVLGRILMVRQAHHDGITVVSNADEGSISIDVETLPGGVYFVKAIDKNGNTMNAKFVKE